MGASIAIMISFFERADYDVAATGGGTL